MTVSQNQTVRDVHHYPEVGVPLFWPFGFAAAVEEAGLDAVLRNLKYLNEVTKTQVLRPEPQWTTPNSVALELHTLRLREFSSDRSSVPVLVVAPYAGHTAVIADFHEGQSLVAALMENGCPRVLVTDWKTASPTMRDYDIDNYLEEIDICVGDLGGRADIVGLCQGGWCAAMYAARYPAKVEKLVLAGSPIDTDAGDGLIKQMAHALPMSFYLSLVATGEGVMKGAFMLQGYKNMHPARQYAEKFIELYENVDDPTYVDRFETFERWYEYTLDLPGGWYLQAVEQLFKENRLANGTFVALGRQIDLFGDHLSDFSFGGRR